MPIPIAAGIAAAGAASALGNLFGQSSANKANVKLARETNALQYKMFQEGNAFAAKQQQLANEWNSPINQRKMLEQAGYNPASLNDVNIGAANGASSVGTPSLATPHVEPLQYGNLASVALQAYQAFNQAENIKADTVGKNIDNEYKAANYDADLKLKGAQSGNLDMQSVGQKIKNMVDFASMSSDATARKATADNLVATAEKTSSEAKFASIQATLEEIYGPQKAEEIVNNLKKEGSLTEEKIRTEQHQQTFFDNSGKAALKQAEASETTAKANLISANAAALVAGKQADKLDAETKHQIMENNIYAQFGETEAGVKLWSQQLSNMQNYQEYALTEMLRDWYKTHPNAYGFQKWVETYVKPFLSPGAAASLGAAMTKVIPK